MKFSFNTLALAASFSPLAFAAPTSENALVSRQTSADAPAALARMQELYSSITPHTAAISTSTLTLPPLPPLFPPKTLPSYPIHPTLPHMT